MKGLFLLFFLLLSFHLFSQEKKELISLNNKEVILKVYPNPSKTGDKLVVKFDRNVLVKKVEVFDLFGKSILHQEFSFTAKSEVNIGELPSGIFLLRIQMYKKVATRRIIVK